MDYSAAASKISAVINKINSKMSELKAKDIDSSWSGSAHDTLSSNLKNCYSKMDKYVGYLNNIVSALEHAKKYKDKKKEKEDYETELANLDTNASNYNSLAGSLKTKISYCNVSLSNYAHYANNSINGIGSISKEYTVVEFQVESANGYMLDLDSLFSLFQNGSLKKMADGDSLYNYYSESEVDAMLADVHAKYTGRAAAVNSALGIIDMAAKKGLKLDYDFGGGHTAVTDVDQVAAGVDCSAFASWARNMGTVGDTPTTTSGYLAGQGTSVNYSSAQPGDILAKDGHAIFIIRNDVDQGRFICAEARGSNIGVVLSTRTYSELTNDGYSARDMTSYYGN